MKLDRLIKNSKLIERLDKVDPDNATGSKNDGINYWKGKKIVSLAKWKKKIGRNDELYQKDIEGQRIKESFQYFPDDYEESLFQIELPQELMKAAKEWESQYYELMRFRNNLKCGRAICFNCLLCPDKEEHGNLVGISRLMARAIERNSVGEEVEDRNSNSKLDDTPTATESVYPCSVLNRFKCPYERQEWKKQLKHQHQSGKEDGEGEGEEDSDSYDVEHLFGMEAVSSRLESAFIKARKEKSIGPIENVEDIYNALTDRETLDKLLQQALDEERLKNKDKIVEFFISMKDNMRVEDLTFYKTRDA